MYSDMSLTKACLLLLFCVFSLSVRAQTYQENQSIEISTETLRKANAKLKKRLEKLERKLSKRRKGQNTQNLDSLIKGGLQNRQEDFKKEASDSLHQYLDELKAKLKQDLAKAPEKLPISDEVKESIQQIQALQSVVKDPRQLQKALGIKEIKSLSHAAENLKGALSQYKEEFKDWDQKLLDQVTSLPEAKLLKEQMDRAKSFKPLPDKLTQKAEQFQNNDFVKEELAAKAEELKKLGAQTLQEKFNAAQSRLSEAKAKFPSLPSLEEAPKQYRPLAGKPLMKRIRLGGNLQINQQKPRSVNIALSVSFQVSEKINLGTSGVGRIFLEKGEATQLRQEQMGIRSFARYQLWRNFYGQANYEFTQIERSSQERAENGRWVQTALIGLGKSTRLSQGICMNVTAFYDFFYNRLTSPNPHPLVVRLGFDFSKR